MAEKCKLNSIEVLVSKSLIDSNISQDEFVLINNVIEGISRNEKFEDLIKDFSLFIKQCYYIVWSAG